MDTFRQYLQHKPNNKFYIFGLVIIVGFLFARYTVWTATQHTNVETARLRFDEVVTADTQRLQNHLEVYANTLYSGRALYATEPSVSRQDWTNFVNAQNIKQRYPGIYGISYVSVIDRSQAAGLTQTLNNQRFTTEANPRQIYPASTNQRLAVLTYLAPTDVNQQAIGYDLFTSPARTQVLEAARDSGLPRASVPLTLVTDPKDMSPSLLVAMPIYDTSVALTTVAERQAALKGYTILSARTQPLLDGVFKNPTLYGAISVTTTADGQVIYRSGPTIKGKLLHKTVVVDVSGQTWQLDFSAPPNFSLGSVARFAPAVVLANTISFLAVLVLALYYAIGLRLMRQRHGKH